MRIGSQTLHENLQSQGLKNILQFVHPIHVPKLTVMQDGATEKPSAPEDSTELELRPHPCTFLRQNRLLKGHILRHPHLSVNVLPANYPYLPFRFSNSPNAKFQVPFFCFSGPDPPPADIGSLGDVYIAPAASTLTVISQSMANRGGAWTRWTAVIPRRDLKLDEPGFLHHPYFPAQTKPFAEDDDPDAEAAAKILVARALQNWEDKATKKVANLKRKTMDEGEPQKNPQKKTRRALQSDCPVTLPEPRSTRGRLPHRPTKEIREQEEAIAGLEMKNASLKVSVDYQTVSCANRGAEDGAAEGTIHPPPCAAPRMPFHPEFLDFMRETFACEVMRTCNAQRVAAETAASDGAHLPFTRSTDVPSTPFAARVQVNALESKLARRMSSFTHPRQVADPPSRYDGCGLDVNVDTAAADKPTTIAQLEEARTYDRKDYTLRTARHNVALRAAETTIWGLENKIKELQAEIDRGLSPCLFTTSLHRGSRCSLLRLAEACISDQQSKIAELEAEVSRLTHSAERETDALRRLLAARESSKEPR
ncbi:hypothetical protein B0H13DRAFT_2662500 [Mycena leptocephala]|nr:hypothetical protein B0H13DRAFT_2662500 [Mycena leptocephala]